MTEKIRKVDFERMNETFRLELYDDGTVAIVDLADGEVIATKADRLPALSALTAEMEKFRKGDK